MVLNTCPGRAVAISPELLHHHHHHPRRVSEYICGENNIYINDFTAHKLQWVSGKHTKNLMLDCTAEERAVHNEFDTERMTVKHPDGTSQDTDSCWYSLRNQMFSCSWCWSWCAAAVGNRPSSPAQNPRANRTIENEISETCKLDLPLYSTAYSILYIGVVEYYIQINK